MRLRHGVFENKTAPTAPLLPHVEALTARGVALVAQFERYDAMVDRATTPLSWRHDPPSAEQWEEALYLVYSLTHLTARLAEKSEALEADRDAWREALKHAAEMTGLRLLSHGKYPRMLTEIDLEPWRRLPT